MGNTWAKELEATAAATSLPSVEHATAMLACLHLAATTHDGAAGGGEPVHPVTAWMMALSRDDLAEVLSPDSIAAAQKILTPAAQKSHGYSYGGVNLVMEVPLNVAPSDRELLALGRMPPRVMRQLRTLFVDPKERDWEAVTSPSA